MDKPEDTLIISASSDLEEYQISTLNIEDIIKDINIDYPSMNQVGPLYSTAIPSINSQYNNTSPNSAGLSSPYTINTNGWQSPNYTFTNTYGPSGLKVEGDAEIEGDIKWKGRSLGDMLSTIERRLSILTPDPEKLEHFEALRKAYEHYKTLEALCELPPKENE